MANFESAAKKTLILEGDYINDPGDYGGETRFGITKRYYPDVDIANLTVEEAKAIYKRDYWDKLNLDNLKNQAVAEEIFDTAINMGWPDAGKMLQKSLNLLTNNQLIVDGLLGPKTLAIENNYSPKEALLIALNGYQFMAYEEQARTDPKQKRFIKGWLLNRVSLGSDE